MHMKFDFTITFVACFWISVSLIGKCRKEWHQSLEPDLWVWWSGSHEQIQEVHDKHSWCKTWF